MNKSILLPASNESQPETLDSLLPVLFQYKSMLGWKVDSRPAPFHLAALPLGGEALTTKEKWGQHSVARPVLYSSIFPSVLLLSFLGTAHSSHKWDLEHRVRFGSSLPTQGPIFLSYPLAQGLGVKTESLIPSFLPQIMRQSPFKGSHLQWL